MEKGFEAMQNENHNASFVFSFAAEAHMTTRNFCLWSVIYCLWKSSHVTVLHPVRSFWQVLFYGIQILQQLFFLSTSSHIFGKVHIEHPFILGKLVCNDALKMLTAY